jgi:surface antigen
MYIAWLLWLDRGYIPEFNNLGNAGEWATEAAGHAQLGVFVSKTPSKWSVAQWVSGNHVAFVEDAYFDPYGNAVSIVVTEDNLAKSTSKRRITPGDKSWPDNFINFGMTFTLSGGGGGGMVAYSQPRPPGTLP